jgi:putative spermidine/putrescine transport system permease protein
MAYSSTVPVAGEPAGGGGGTGLLDGPTDEVAAGAPKPERAGLKLLGAVPFLVYAVLFLGVPTVALVIGAFQTPTGGHFTLHNLHIATTGAYRHGLWISIKLSIIAAILPAIAGLVLAYAVHTAPRGNTLRRVVTTASGVFANFGGVPLAFIFIATIGTTGLATGWLNDIGINLTNDFGFDLFGFSGVTLAYFYFQVPLMVLVITPALEGLKPAWREAADNLGAGSWSYWRLVGGPVLLPSFLGAVLLLFGSSFSAYATAEALTAGSIPLTSIQIGSFLNGNVISGQENVGKALGLTMIVVITVLMVFYTLLQKRSSKWLR